MLDLALHPKFAENQLIYFTYHKPLTADTYTHVIADDEINRRALFGSPATLS